MTELEEYYNKFNEEKRLNSRHGQVEFRTSLKYIHKFLRRNLRFWISVQVPDATVWHLPKKAMM